MQVHLFSTLANSQPAGLFMQLACLIKATKLLTLNSVAKSYTINWHCRATWQWVHLLIGAWPCQGQAGLNHEEGHLKYIFTP